MTGEVIDDALRVEEVRLIARSTHLPVDDCELALLGNYVDGYDAGHATDYALSIQARAKARAYIAQRVAEHPRWDSGLDGAIGAMTAELREKLMLAAESGA